MVKVSWGAARGGGGLGLRGEGIQGFGSRKPYPKLTPYHYHMALVTVVSFRVCGVLELRTTR